MDRGAPGATVPPAGGAAVPDLSASSRGRALAAFYTAGGASALVWALLPGTAPRGGAVTAALAATAACAGLVLWLRPVRWGARGVHAGLALLQLAIGLAYVAQADPTSSGALFFLWAAPYAALHLRQRAAAAHALWAAVVVLTSLALMPAHTHGEAAGAALALLSTLGATTVLVARYASALRAAERAQRHDASHDPLTGLPNRRRLLGALSRGPHGAGTDALVMLDLDGFKAVNDRHGHAEGDALLQAVAARLRACTREDDLVCRLGGDEFAVVLRALDEPGHAEEVSRRLVAELGTLREGVTCSAGVRLLEPALGAERALRDADTALYLSKRERRARPHVWSRGLQSEDGELRAMARDLRDGMAHGQLSLVYQPVADARTMRVRGLEALARWHHPVRGDVPPDRFVTCAEQSGLIAELTRWALHTACTEAMTWPVGPDGDRLNLSVNLSAVQLADLLVVDDVRAALQASGLPPRRLLLEVTETAAVVDLAGARRTLEELAALGVVIALDDFGTGHSSLTHVLALPVHILKVDRSFTAAAVAGDRRAVAAVAAVCALGARLEVDVVAEGVEDQACLPDLVALGCFYAQGFGLARPMAPAAVHAALAVQGEQGWLVGTPAAPAVLVAG